MSAISNPCDEGPGICPPSPGCIPHKRCLEAEDLHLHESLPLSFVPTIPVKNDFHRIKTQPQCNDLICGQRIQLITMQGHEIRMMDNPSEASNITLTTSDATQQIRLDEMNKITWITSHNHHFVMADSGHAKANEGLESATVKYVDPNDAKDALNTSSYILLQTESKHNFWMADTPQYPRIHAHTIEGHELLMLDKAPQHPKGKIQLTTYDKLMQIVMDVDSGDILITNLNTAGAGGNTTNNNACPGSIKFYALGDIEFHAEKSIGIYSNEHITLGAPDGTITATDNSTTLMKLPAPPGIPPVPGEIKPSVLTDLVSLPKSAY